MKGTVGTAEIEITVVVKDDTKPDPVGDRIHYGNSTDEDGVHSR